MRSTPRSTLFPYTTLFRSEDGDVEPARTPFDRVGGGEGDVETRDVEELGRVWLPVLGQAVGPVERPERRDRKSTRLNSSHSQISYAVFCLKQKRTCQPRDR